MFYIVNIAVQWPNGDLEGFGSSGGTELSARHRAISKADRKSKDMLIGGFKILTSTEYADLSVEQQDELQADWDQESL